MQDWGGYRIFGASHRVALRHAGGSFDALYGNVAGCLSEGIFFGVGWGGEAKTWIRERDLLFCPQIVALTCFCVSGKGGGNIGELFGCVFSSLGVNLSIPLVTLVKRVFAD